MYKGATELQLLRVYLLAVLLVRTACLLLGSAMSSASPILMQLRYRAARVARRLRIEAACVVVTRKGQRRRMEWADWKRMMEERVARETKAERRAG